MGRYIREIELHLPAEQVDREISAFLEQGNFYPTLWKGVNCFCADGRPDTLPRSMRNAKQIYFFLFDYHNGLLHTEAWLRDGKEKEIELTGHYNWMLKQPYLQQIIKLEENLIEKLPQDSKLRENCRSHMQNLKKEHKKMHLGKKAIGILSIFLFLWAFINCIAHLGIF